jgi:hypothetical protein
MAVHIRYPMEEVDDRAEKEEQSMSILVILEDALASIATDREVVVRPGFLCGEGEL